MLEDADLTTVLVVDDDEAVRSFMARVLEEEGYEVVQAGNGVEALSLLDRRDSGVVHLVITDVRMPYMDGRDFAASLARRAASPPVLFVSGSHTRADVPGPMLSKPFLPDELRALVRGFLEFQGSQRAAS
jgi:DNA-binding response OmpR family regulator